jgi:hypothetical protein
MKNIIIILNISLLFLIVNCKPKPDCGQILEVIQENYEFGNFNTAFILADSLKKCCDENKEIIRFTDSLVQIAQRICLDFSLPEDQIKSQIEKLNGLYSVEEKREWENKGWLECRQINGGKMYFNRAASNLMLIRKFYEQKEERLREIGEDPRMKFRLNHTKEVLNASDNQSLPVVPVNMKITYTITVNPEAVPEGETIRCWLPWPKEGKLRQKNVKMISTSNKEYIISPDSAIHSTIYMEEISKKGVPAIFQISYLYQSSGQYFNLDHIKLLPNDKSTENYIKYTSEELPHISFTENIKLLADSITSPDDNPVAVVRKIYYWFKENIPWTGALEYSIMPNIPEYVFQNRRGDCGMQTFLFMSMLRYKGVPVRWQSGWMMPPGAENLHDWCEVYYEETGWVPVDVSYDLQKSDKTEIRDFYLSGIDSYRLIVNEGIAGPLHPEKQYLRSEPYDFQRGEVEWKGGNLYFDKWDYDMKIEYVK